MDQVKHGTDTLFILLGAIMVLAMHSGFAFLELGTVRKKNQVNALVKILATLPCRRSRTSSSAMRLPMASASSAMQQAWRRRTATSWSSSSFC
jgi:hypothetical protein